MTTLDIRPDLEQAPWSDLDRDAVKRADLAGIGLLRHGTVGGQASVALRMTTDDGTVVIAETTWKLLRTAVEGLTGSPVVAEEVW